jgi:hypothetical protein
MEHFIHGQQSSSQAGPNNAHLFVTGAMCDLILAVIHFATVCSGSLQERSGGKPAGDGGLACSLQQYWSHACKVLLSLDKVACLYCCPLYTTSSSCCGWSGCELQVVVPSTYSELTSRRVLTVSWLDGEKLSQSKADDVGDLVNIGVICYLKQLLDTGFFHAGWLKGLNWWALLWRSCKQGLAAPGIGSAATCLVTVSSLPVRSCGVADAGS